VVASVSPTWLLCVVSMAAVTAAVSGCATTQDANKRIDARFDRTLSSRKPLDFTGSDPDVRVTDTAVVKGKEGSAIVVLLRNHGDHPVNDLPIEVGPRGGRPLNTEANVPYFQSHAPAIAPGEEVAWVYTTKEPLPSGAAFARVGARPAAAPTADNLPDVTVDDSSLTSGRDAGSVQTEVRNDSGVPQYDLDVYAVARRGGRYVAAGRTTLEHLGVSKSAHLTLSLLGDAKGAHVQVFAPPTLFE